MITYRLGTPEDYDDILKLRHLAYSKANKIKSPNYKDTASKFDAYSEQLVAVLDGKIIGAMRLGLPMKREELEDYQFMKEWPKSFPEPHEIIEPMRAAVHPDHRKVGKVFIGLVQFCMYQGIVNGRSYVCTSSDARLKKLYNSIGIKDLGMTYNHSDLSNIEHYILFNNLRKMLLSFDCDVKQWRKVWYPVLQLLRREGHIKLNSVEAQTVTFLRLFPIFLLKEIHSFLF